jgi:hypothetical protein
MSIAMDESEGELMRYHSIRALSRATQANAELTDTLLSVLLNTKVDAWVRRGAARALGEKANDKTPRVVNSLVRILEDTSEPQEVRWGAADALTEVSKVDSHVTTVLIGIARNNGDDAVVRRGALLSTDATNPRAITLFLDILRNTNAETEMRSHSAFKLWYAVFQGDQSAINALLSVLRRDGESDALRGNAAWALAREEPGRADVTETLLVALRVPGSRDEVLEALWWRLRTGRWSEATQ